MSGSGKAVELGGEVRPFTRSSGTLMQPASSAVLRVSSPLHFLKMKEKFQ